MEQDAPCAGGVGGGGGSVFAILMYDDVVCRCVVFNVDDLIAWHGIHYAARKSHELRLCSGRVRPARGEELLPVGYTQAHELYHQKGNCSVKLSISGVSLPSLPRC